jgi:hypothetical protein
MKRKVLESVTPAACFAVLLGMFSLLCAVPSRAQATPSQQRPEALAASETNDNAAVPTPAPAPAVADQTIASLSDAPAAAATPAAAPRPATGQVGLPPDDSGWHIIVAPYLWLPGVYGTVGKRNVDASIHATPGDLLSNFRFGLMGLVDLRYKRIIIPIDMMWVRLADSKALPFPNLEEVSAKMKGGEFILTPKIGYRLLNMDMVKVDALAGFRYWHFSESLKFSPSPEGVNFSASQDWVDPLVGARILGNLSPKIEVSIGGDVGGWGAGSQLDYQVVGLIGYRIKPNVALQVGYRYLDVNYRSGGTIIDTITHGAVLGATITLK